MEMIQEILVFIIFIIAAGYIVTKFIWKPAFMKSGSKSDKACGSSDCGCH